MKVNIRKLLKHPKLFFSSFECQNTCLTRYFKIALLFQDLSILSVSLRNERNNFIGNSTIWGEVGRELK